MATIVFRDWAAMEEHSDKEIIGRLLPDQPAMARMSDGASPSSMGIGTCRSSDCGISEVRPVRLSRKCHLVLTMLIGSSQNV
jgi:hypothetical protein